jgi:hypothetical protein
MWLPEWLYGRLPALYLLAAVASPWILGVSFATALSSFSLFAAALLTHGVRRNARRPPPSGPRPAGRH